MFQNYTPMIVNNPISGPPLYATFLAELLIVINFGFLIGLLAWLLSRNKLETKSPNLRLILASGYLALLTLIIASFGLLIVAFYGSILPLIVGLYIAFACIPLLLIVIVLLIVYMMREKS